MDISSSSSKRAMDFYQLFRSGNHFEVISNLKELAKNTDLDRHDLAFLMVILRTITDCHLRRVVLHDQKCLTALSTILENVQRNESTNDSKPFLQDVTEVEEILRAPPLSPDIS